jgi:DNA-directed RNA polymerase specialized sigma24 family protein
VPKVTILLTADVSAHTSASAVGASQKRLCERGKALIFSRFKLAAEMLLARLMIETAKYTEDMRKDAADLYWLAFLLTERQDLSIDIAADTVVSEDNASSFFGEWMRGWQRRLVIGRALTAIHKELADSARRTELAHVHGSTAPHNWSLSPDTTKTELQHALLSIDLFPRAALLLLVFEGMRMADAVTLLNADHALIRKAQAIGLGELTANLADQNSPQDRRGNKVVTAEPKKLCSWLRIVAVCH